MFIRLPQIKARIVRLREVTLALCNEVKRWRVQDGPLTPLERRRYLNGMQKAVAGLDDARHALAAAAERLEEEGR